MIDDRFSSSRSSVAIAAIGNAFEALVLRSILESLNASVQLHLIGCPEDLLKILGQTEHVPDYLILSAHGDENGIVFGPFDEHIDVSALAEGSMPASSIAARVRLPGATILTTACLTGTDEFQRAFLAGGAVNYIAPAGYPEGADVPLFVHLLFHRILQQNASVMEAYAEARLHADSCGDFTALSAESLTRDPGPPLGR